LDLDARPIPYLEIKKKREKKKKNENEYIILNQLPPPVQVHNTSLIKYVNKTIKKKNK
jgi:hypothetical protein